MAETNYNGITLFNVLPMRGTLFRLNYLLTKANSRVELRGWNLALDNDGLALVTILSDIWETKVVAGKLVQFVGSTPNLWTPPVVSVTKGGAPVWSNGTPL